MAIRRLNHHSRRIHNNRRIRINNQRIHNNQCTRINSRRRVYFKGKCQDVIACPEAFSHNTDDIDRIVWKSLVKLLRYKDPQGRSFLHLVADRQTHAHKSEKLALVSSRGATEQLVDKTTRERDNAIRAFEDALKRDYDETNLAWLQELINKKNQQLAELVAKRNDDTKQIEQHQRVDTALDFTLQRIHELGENSDNADWEIKRQLLYLMGVKVYIFRKGAYDDGYGHRWRIHFDWEGLEEIAQRVLYNEGVIDSISL